MERLRVYENKIKVYSKQLKRDSRKLDIIGNLRLLIVLVGLISVFYTFFHISEEASWISLIVSLITFIILVKVYQKIKNKVRTLESLININTTNINRLKGKWTEFEDMGNDFIDKDHNFSFDLDVFGKGSLYQWMNVSITPRGRKKLKDLLTVQDEHPQGIIHRQEAVTELAKDLDWRQNFNSLGLLLPNKDDTDINNLFQDSGRKYLNNMIIILSNLLPVLTLGSLVASYGFNMIRPFWSICLVVLQFILTLLGGKDRSTVLNSLSSINTNIRTYTQMLFLLENKKFNCDLLVSLQNKLKSPKGEKGYNLLREFNAITDRSGNRKNFFFFPINVLLLWDYTTMIRLVKWKNRAGKLLDNLIDVVGEVEAFSSLAQISYDNPKWAMPNFATKDKSLIAKEMGHPLLGDSKVTNDVKLDEKTPMLLITGSNMSGKSTLLRTVGINMILAYAGSAVCAKKMELSIYELHTSMRISDNLEKSISSFYGELLRIKGILESNKQNNSNTFVLLDEIFKGTNSYDRHIGAKGLIKQLLNQSCMGLVSTHDLELEVLEKERQGLIKNFHFQEHYVDDKIMFDYKLKEGVSKTRNALYLLKLMGIEV